MYFFTSPSVPAAFSFSFFPALYDFLLLFVSLCFCFDVFCFFTFCRAGISGTILCVDFTFMVSIWFVFAHLPLGMHVDTFLTCEIAAFPTMKISRCIHYNRIRILILFLSIYSTNATPIAIVYCTQELKMDVSLNGGTPKSPHFHRVFHYKPSILGYHNFWKPPNGFSNVALGL